MSNKTVEAIKNGDRLSTEELFQLINAYDMTMLSIQDKNNKKLNLIIIHVESGQKFTASNGYYEISLCGLNEFLQEDLLKFWSSRMVSRI